MPWTPVDPEWAKDVALGVEVGTTHRAGQARWDSARWDKGRWSGLEPVWKDVSCTVYSADYARGGDSVLDPPDAETATIEVDNSDGWAAMGSTKAAVEPLEGRPLRLWAVNKHDGQRHVLWSGWIEKIEPTYEHGPYGRTATITATDSLGIWGVAKTAKRDIPVGDDDSVDERLQRLATEARWPTQWLDLDNSPIPLLPTELDGAILNQAQDAVKCEGGTLYAGRDLHVVFRSRDWLRVDPESIEPQARIANDGDPLAVCPTSLDTDGPDLGTVENRIVAGREKAPDEDDDPPLHQYDDDQSQAKFRIRAGSEYRYPTWDEDQIELLARRRLRLLGKPARRIKEAAIDPLALHGTQRAAAWGLVLGVTYGWRVTVAYRDPEGWGWSGDAHVCGIAAEITPEGWQVTLSLSDAAFFRPGSGWDTARWDKAKWGIQTLRKDQHV